MRNTRRSRQRSSLPEAAAPTAAGARPIPAVFTRALLASAFLAFAGCDSREAPPPEVHPDWVIQARIEILPPGAPVQPAAPVPSAPGQPRPQPAAVAGLSLDSFRLSFSYISGDLYGPPTTADFIHPQIRPDLTFEIDLNRTHADLLRSLEPTDFSQDYLKIEPAQARIARLSPQALQCDGIEQIGTVDWIDARTRERLMLVYMDRPSRITGALARAGHTVRYNIRAGVAGYVWVARRETETGAQMYTEVSKPAEIALAITPRPGIGGDCKPPPVKGPAGTSG